MSAAPSDLLAARASALAYLSRRDHAESELRQKLQRKGYTESAIGQVLADMRKAGYLDDARFAENHCRLRAEAGYGPIKIRYELQCKGVVPENITHALAALECDFFETCQAVYRRKYGDTPVTDLKDKARRQRFLYQRGFEPETIRATVPDLL